MTDLIIAPQISVIVCTYNRGRQLLDTLASLSTQTLPITDYEVIIVDNHPFPNNDVLELVTTCKTTTFLLYSNRLRYVYCASRGLSQARNFGVSVSKGEIICFIDDDALASPEWLETIKHSFDEHPNAGVIGGHILLKVPTPRPGILKPGFEVYWSQLVTNYSKYTEVQTWYKFPWGANWCARKKILIEIGGFDARYGRYGNNFWGGEELVAASLIQRLGYKIAINPQSIVIHNVDPKRYSLWHLCRTILASKMVRYQAQKDKLI